MATGHFRIPDDLAARTDLNWNQKAILGFIGRQQDYQGNGASCTLTYDMIAASLGLSKRQVIAEIQGDKRRQRSGIPKEDLLIVRTSRPTGAARTPPNQYSARWAVQRAMRRKHAEKKLLQFPAVPGA